MHKKTVRYPIDKAFELDTGCFLMEFAAQLQDDRRHLQSGAVLQLRTAGRLTRLIEPQDRGLNALVIWLPDDFEQDLVSLVRQPPAVEPQSLFVLRGGSSRVALRIDKCFALRDGIEPAGLVLCLWAGGSLVVRRVESDAARRSIRETRRKQPARQSTRDVEVDIYMDLILDHIDAASQAKSAIEAASDGPDENSSAPQ